jgi:hypothetical protein
MRWWNQHHPWNDSHPAQLPMPLVAVDERYHDPRGGR